MERFGWIRRLSFSGMAFVLAALVGCGDGAVGNGTGGGNGNHDGKVLDLMEDVAVDGRIGLEGVLGEDKTEALADFSVRLFGQCVEAGKNTLVSPLSVFCALAMTANGAKGETLAQMEEVLGADAREWNDYLRLYFSRLPMGDGYKMNVANSIWLRNAEGFAVEPDFLQVNGVYYGAGVYQAAFGDSTVGDINGWVKEHTDGMVGDILDRIPDEAVMYLINAIAFDAEWQSVYWDYQVRDGIFTKEDGVTQDVEMMYSEEWQYLEDEHAQGFLKYYKDGKYAFAALLPEEGLGVADYAGSLTGERLLGILGHPEEVKVKAAIPKFENGDSMEMDEILEGMGMEDAFDVRLADFSGIGSYEEANLFLGRVLHKTFIGINEQGTKAGAATVVEMAAGAAEEREEEIKVVHLDRPFVYMIVDCETNLPVFIGAEASVE